MNDGFMTYERIGILHRITNAFTQSIYSFCNGIYSILLSPIVFFQTLGISKKLVYDLDKLAKALHSPYHTQYQDPYGDIPQSDEEWKKFHDELYNDKDDKDNEST